MPFFVMWIIYENYFMNLFRKGFDAWYFGGKLY
jgi:hypothetical protein